MGIQEIRKAGLCHGIAMALPWQCHGIAMQCHGISLTRLFHSYGYLIKTRLFACTVIAYTVIMLTRLFAYTVISLRLFDWNTVICLRIFR